MSGDHVREPDLVLVQGVGAGEVHQERPDGPSVRDERDEPEGADPLGSEDLPEGEECLVLVHVDHDDRLGLHRVPRPPLQYST